MTSGAYLREGEIGRLPACRRHFFKGHKWWCRACDRETARQVRALAEDHYRLARDRDDRVRIHP
jgi:hypothetical protein